MNNSLPVFYSRSENSNGERELLSVHLNKTADLAEQFANIFGEGNVGRWCGLFHDLGKASYLFQQVLNKEEHNVMHESAGAYIAFMQKFSPLIEIIIYAHHKGLIWGIESELNKTMKEPDSYDTYSGRRFSVTGKEQYSIVISYIKANLTLPEHLPKLIKEPPSYYHNLPVMLHTRMLLSCLVDADYTASATHFDDSISENVDGEPLNTDKIIRNLIYYRKSVIKKSSAKKQINDLRNTVFDSCSEAASLKPGIFTLTAPTGTGKTLALLEFAVRHAKEYNKNRIIIVLPFLSIISQNARIYKDICGDILEAHSMVSYDEKTRLLSERWNAPVVVTTSVKFFEVFFKYKPSDLRFLHSISNSVIVFDEAQSVPLDLAGTTMETMRIMCEMFGCTILHSTATQPDFSTRKDIAAVPTEIIKDIPDLYKKAKRVTVEWRLDSEVGFVVIAGEMAKKHNACCVVNRKDHAFILFGLLKEKIPDGCFYITTDMCKVHRDDTIKSVTERLENKLPCYLVATSCIEAGVDLDFGCMFRALAPLDSIIQCAGRCNRNGKGNGEMTVFVPDEDRLYPNDRYARAAEIIRLITSRHAIDIDNPEHIKEYYSELYSRYSEDKQPLVNAIDKYDFAEAEKQYRFIPSAGANVLVPYEPCRKLYDELLEEAKSKGISKTWIKKAAPLTISSYQTDKLDEFCEKCFIITKHGKEKIEGWYILYDESLYDEKTGLHFTDETSIDFMI